MAHDREGIGDGDQGRMGLYTREGELYAKLARAVAKADMTDPSWSVARRTRDFIMGFDGGQNKSGMVIKDRQCISAISALITSV